MPWSNSQAQSANPGVDGSGQGSLAFASNVTAGQVIVAAACGRINLGTGAWSDTSSNVATWASFGQQPSINFNAQTMSLAWGVATTTGACTPRFTSGSAFQGMAMYIASFTAPTGTPATDGTFQNGTASGGTANTAANGSGSSDLLLSLVAWDSTFTAYGGSWTQISTSVNAGTPSAAGYILNAAGSSADSSTGTTNWWDIVVAVTASAGGGGATLTARPITWPQAMFRSSYR